MIQISDGNTVSSVKINDQTIYPNIGSGTICKLSWEAAANIANYAISMYIYRGDGLADTSNMNIGLCNEFYITSEMCPSDTTSIRVSIGAFKTTGQALSVGEAFIPVAESAGIYVRVTDGYTQPIMKRAIALAQVSDSSEDSGLLISSDNFELVSADFRLLAEDILIWAIMKDFYKKNDQGTWDSSDITYEVLTAQNGDIITTATGDFIYLK